MLYKQRTNKTLLTYDDLEYNRRLGLPIEIYCTNQNRTIAFGRIEALTNHGVIINQSIYSGSEYVFFGLTKKKIMLNS